MEPEVFRKEISDKRLEEIFHKISEERIGKIQRICMRYGEGENKVRNYDVYVFSTGSGSKILKKADEWEARNYERYLSGHSFPVPKYFGKWEDGTDTWILIEDVSGSDLKDMTETIAAAAADSLAAIQNAFWNHPDEDRFAVYRERIERRFRHIQDVPVTGEAYGIFLKRQFSCPRTLSNGDFLAYNAIDHEGKVVIIDWGSGGIMPYSLDIARFIAHGTEDRATFPFYMNEEQKKLFVDRVYENLTQKPEYSVYLNDVRLAVLNEYVGIVVADEDENGWYRVHARKLAEEILSETPADQR